MLIGVYMASVRLATRPLRKECLVSTRETPLGQADLASTVLGPTSPKK
jgi:hypothetical protein